MCPKSPAAPVNKPAYAPEQIDQNITVEEEPVKDSVVGSPGKSARDVNPARTTGGVAVKGVKR